MVIKLPRSRESTPVAVTPPSTTLGRLRTKSPTYGRTHILSDQTDEPHNQADSLTHEHDHARRHDPARPPAGGRSAAPGNIFVGARARDGRLG
jgi:hypothetical protein